MSAFLDLTSQHRGFMGGRSPCPLLATSAWQHAERLAAVIDLAERRRTNGRPAPPPCRPCVPFCCRGTQWRCPMAAGHPCRPCGGTAA